MFGPDIATIIAATPAASRIATITIHGLIRERLRRATDPGRKPGGVIERGIGGRAIPTAPTPGCVVIDGI